MAASWTRSTRNPRKRNNMNRYSTRKHFISKLYILAHVLLIHEFTCDCHALSIIKPSSPSSLLRRIRSIIPSRFRPLSLPFYEDGLEFSCTGCSKCCKVDGDVWLAPEEVSNIVKYLSTKQGNHIDDKVNEVASIDDFRKNYVRAEIAPDNSNHDNENGDNTTTESWMCLKRTEGSCIFLDPAGQCTIYDARPVQCRTYPFWPSLLDSLEDWNDEAVLPDDIDIVKNENAIGRVVWQKDRHWSPELGGCEGIGKVIDAVASLDELKLENVDLDQMMKEQEDAVIVAREEIIAKCKEAKRHWKRFPGEEIKRTSWYL